MNYRLILILLLSFFYVNDSFSQLVNIEKRRNRTTDTLIGSIGISANFLKNTKDVRNIKGNFALERSKNNHIFLLYAELAYSNVDGVDIVNNGYQHLRYNYSFETPGFLTLELFVQNQYNSIKLLEHRNLVGGGTRLRIFNNDKIYLYFSPLFMYEREVLSDGKSTINERFKGDFYITTGIQINPVFSIKHVTYYQPWISDFSEFRVFSETGFAFNAFKRLTFSLNYQFSYDSNPPVDYNLDEPTAIPNLFYTLKNVITFKF